MKSNAVKSLFAQSLRELLETNQIQNISVREIADNCGLSTRAFYNHFTDKHDLVKYVYVDLNEECWFEDGKLCHLEKALDRWGRQVRSNISFFINTFSYTGQNNIREAVMEKGCSDLTRLLKSNGHGDLLENFAIKELIRFYMSGLAAMLDYEVTNPKNTAPWAGMSNYLFYLPSTLYQYLSEKPDHQSEKDGRLPVTRNNNVIHLK